MINNSLFLFFAFLSTAFYPAQGLPEPLAITFYFNPLTYIVDIGRAGIFSQYDAFTNFQALIIGLVSLAVFIVATRTMSGMKV